MRWFDVAWCYLDWWLWDCCVSQRPSVSRMRRFCRHFLWEPRPAFTSVTSDLSSHGEPWVHTCTDAQHLGPYSAAACFFSDCGEFSCECVWACCWLQGCSSVQHLVLWTANARNDLIHMVLFTWSQVWVCMLCPLVMTQLMNAVFFTDWLFWKKKACFAQWSAKLTRYVLNRLKHAKPERHGL